MTTSFPNPNPGRHYARKRTPREKPEWVPTFTQTPVNDCGAEISRGRWCRKPYPCPEHGDTA